MNPLRKAALVAGAFYVVTFVSIPTPALYAAERGASFVVGPVSTVRRTSAFLEAVVALAGISTVNDFGASRQSVEGTHRCQERSGLLAD
jgi:hypothetical protein